MKKLMLVFLLLLTCVEASEICSSQQVNRDLVEADWNFGKCSDYSDALEAAFRKNEPAECLTFIIESAKEDDCWISLRYWIKEYGHKYLDDSCLHHKNQDC